MHGILLIKFFLAGSAFPVVRVGEQTIYLNRKPFSAPHCDVLYSGHSFNTAQTLVFIGLRDGNEGEDRCGVASEIMKMRSETKLRHCVLCTVR